MYQAILESGLLTRLLVVLLPLIVIAIPCGLISIHRSVGSMSDISLMTSTFTFVGASFIFIGSFANVTAWQGADRAVTNLKNELSSLSSLAESILDYEPQPVLTDAIGSIVSYVEAVRDGELNASNNDGAVQSASADERTRRTKNAALTESTSESNEIEQAALDIRNSILNIEKADVVNERDLARMLEQVSQFQDARRDRISTRWPLVSDVVMFALLIVTIVAVVVFGLFPVGESRNLKWLQIGGCSLVVSAIWFAVLSTQNLSVSNPAIRIPVDAFLSRYR